jgi:alpha-glucosidase
LLTVEAQAADPGSMLNLYRNAIRLRRTEPDLAGESMQWLDGPADVLAFRRGAQLACIVNFGAAPIQLPAGSEVLLGSAPLPSHGLEPDAAAWVRLPGETVGQATTSGVR